MLWVLGDPSRPIPGRACHTLGWLHLTTRLAYPLRTVEFCLVCVSSSLLDDPQTMQKQLLSQLSKAFGPSKLKALLPLYPNRNNLRFDGLRT